MCYYGVVRCKNLLKGDRFMRKRQKRRQEFFKCEICKCKTPLKYEGAEPNTCEMCMPIPKIFNSFDSRANKNKFFKQIFD